MRSTLPIAAVLAIGLASFVAAAHRISQDSGIPPDFVSEKVSDPVSNLVKRLAEGKVSLTYEPEHGYLKSILKELNISPTSQVLVFSKTSLQAAHISPSNPRAIYFNDRVYVGWIPGAPNVELIGIDPQFGPVFYMLTNQAGEKPQLVRKTDDCFQCHFSPVAGRVPSVMARSVFTGPDGTPQLSRGSFKTLATSPIAERWGGWYVTGKHGGQKHMGNVISSEDKTESAAGLNITALSKFFDVGPYLSPHSDIVALMVIEQQMSIQNLITKAGFLTRKALTESADLIKWKFDASYVAKETQSRVDHACEPLVQALIGAGEPSLTSPIQGTSEFASKFSGSAPADKKGRRLSDLDLQKRILRYACSPMIYSEAFAGLPDEAKTRIYGKLKEILSGKDVKKGAAPIYQEDGNATLEILSETLPGFGSQAG